MIAYYVFMEKRDDVYKNRGLHEYGDVKFADNVNKKYPIDTPEHIRAAWSYFHMPRDYEMCIRDRNNLADGRKPDTYTVLLFRFGYVRIFCKPIV